MENLIHYYIKTENKDSLQILKDATIKDHIKLKLMSNGLLILGMEIDSQTESYVMLKYGDYIQHSICTDRSPEMFKDYYPNKVPGFVRELKNK